MERYENIIKIEEIRRLSEDNQYVKALKVLKTLDTNKIKSLTDLSIMADVYTQNEEYDDAMKILTRIYTKNKTRRIVYQLVDLSIKRGDIYESEYYLDKYKRLSSKDSYQYIFRYCIDKLKQEPYDVLIESLEQLKEYEYFEVWAYELAKLYHKAGMKDKCVRECSDIILWFGNGIYVEKSRLLKAYYVGEADPIQMLKTKEKRAMEIRLGLDKTKDYSNIRSEIDKFLADNDEKPEDNTDSKVVPIVEEDEYGVDEITDGLLSSKDSEEKVIINLWNNEEKNSNEKYNKSEEISSSRSSAYEELYSAGVFVESNYEEEYHNELEAEELEEDELEEAEEDEVKEFEVEEAEVKESEVEEAEDEVKDELEESKVEEYELVQVEVGEDESVQDETVQDEPVQDETEEISIPANHLEEDEIEHMIHLIHLKENVYLKKIFGYFICNSECNYQIEAVLNRLLLIKDKGQNLIIIGQRKSGKTTLGKCYAKALCEQNIIKSSKVAKITATKLNRINLLERVDALVDGTLIVEEAGSLEHNTVEQLIQVIQTYVGRLFVCLEDKEGNIDELLKREENLSSYFENIIRIPKWSRTDKLGFVLCHIEDQDYKLSEEGKEILLNALEEIEENVDEAERLEVLFNFVKKAKLSADQRNKSLLQDIMQSRHLEKNDLLYIKEEDFYD